MEYCELLLQSNLSLLKKLGWLIDVYKVIVYLPTNFFQSKLLQFLRLTTKYSNIFGNSEIFFLSNL